MKTHSLRTHSLLTALICLAAISLVACDKAYTVPGGPADLTALGLTPEAKAAATDSRIQRAQDKKPLVTFPAILAIARVQAADFYQNGSNRWHGAYTIVTVRDVEKQADFDQIEKLPNLAGVVALKQILVNPRAHDDEDLREAAAKLHANLLLYYTFDTQFYTNERVRPLGVITLGLFPNQNAHATCTVSAVLMDVNNGYIYGVAEATAKDSQLANAWSSAQAMDDARRRVERTAFEDMLKQFTAEWPSIVKTYNHTLKTP